jgi:signal transduction histidine kinase
MKLRTQFALLTVGIILMPVLVLNGFLLFQALGARPDEQASESLALDRWVSQRVEHTEILSLEDLKATLESHPQGLGLLLMNASGTVLYSSMDEIAVGTAPTATVLTGLLASTGGATALRRSPFLQQEGLVLLSRIPFGPERNSWAFARSRNQFLFFSVSVLCLISLILLLTIVRSLSNSLLTMEAATRRIAAGDLEYAIQEKGPAELASLARSFNTMRQSLREEFARRSRFVMGLSHDLKSPLTMIQGYTEALQDGMETDEATRQRYLGIIADKSRYLRELIAELINFVKLETAEWRKTLEPYRAAPFFAELGQGFVDDARILGKTVTSQVRVPEDLTVVMDPDLVRRALENLMGNALRYSPEGKAAEFTVTLESVLDTRAGSTRSRIKRQLVLRVRDQGPGIAPEDLPRIFEPLFRGESPQESGFGLGLAVVRSVVESHGWTIDVDSPPGGGTCFRIAADLPVTSS